MIIKITICLDLYVITLLQQYIYLSYMKHVFLFPVKVDKIYTYLDQQCKFH